jgi:hydrogenase expression/formation protein HypC
MCLGIPMRVITVDGFNARCTAKGVERRANLLMMQGEEIGAGDYVMVHLGYVVQKMTEEEARTTWELFDQILDAVPPDSQGHTE